MVVTGAVGVLWLGYGLAAAAAGGKGRAVPAGAALLALHNAAGLLLISPVPGTNFSDWAYFSRVMGASATGILVYLAGQVAIWRLLPRLDSMEA